MNKECIDHEGDDANIRDSSDGRDNTSNGGDNTNYPPNVQPVLDLIKWTLESSRNVTLTTETPLESLYNGNNPIHLDPVTYESKYEAIVIDDNPS